MRYSASLVVLAALALPCAASDPVRLRMEKRKPIEVSVLPPAPVQPPPPAGDELLRTVLFPQRAVIQWAFDRVRSGRFTGNVVGLQCPDLDIPIRVTSFGRAVGLRE